jgi:hypothetical protein
MTYLLGFSLIVVAHLASVWICYWLSLLIHEAGHAMAAWLAGEKPRRILIGTEDRLVVILRIFRIPVIIRAWAVDGMVILQRPVSRRWKRVWISAGGPLAGLVAAAAGLGLYFILPDVHAFPQRLLGILLPWFTLWNLWGALRNILPFEAPNRHFGILLSDGLQIIREFYPDWKPARSRPINAASAETSGEAGVRTDPAVLAKLETALLAEDWACAQTLITENRAENPSDVMWIAMELRYRFLSGDDVGVLNLLEDSAVIPAGHEWKPAVVTTELLCRARLGQADSWRSILDVLPRLLPEPNDQVRTLKELSTFAVVEKLTDLCAALLPRVQHFGGDPPGGLSLQAQLGGLLAESGSWEAAGPLLEEGFKQSTALTDPGFSAMLLGEMALKAGRHRDAARWARMAINLDDWKPVVKRAEAVLEAAGVKARGAKGKVQKD